jgi:hypothetical protein
MCVQNSPASLFSIEQCRHATDLFRAECERLTAAAQEMLEMTDGEVPAAILLAHTVSLGVLPEEGEVILHPPPGLGDVCRREIGARRRAADQVFPLLRAAHAEIRSTVSWSLER